MTLGADLSKRTVYLAHLLADKVLFTAGIDIEQNPLDGFTRLKDVMKLSREKQIWIEQPWVNNSNVRPMSSLELGRTAAFVELAALATGLEPIFVTPLAWRKIVYGNGRPKEVKELAREFVLDKFGHQTKYKYQHNECESILLAYYGQLMETKT